MKKKILAMALISVFALLVASCGSSSDTNTTEANTAETSSVESDETAETETSSKESGEIEKEEAETATSGTVDMSVSPSVFYDNYNIIITASTYHHDESQDYILLTIENNSDMDIEVQGVDFVANGVGVEDSYYSFLYQEVNAGETLEESIYDGIYFEVGTLPEDVITIETLSFTLAIFDMNDYHTVDEVTVNLTME